MNQGMLGAQATGYKEELWCMQLVPCWEQWFSSEMYGLGFNAS